ncbi:Cof-type HAD-IIB family hydrolase [Peribacillus frigoritolerans]|uniref:Cof-type HAD-IIB family hydrolase n=1 Tax=Peribacillus frigoritolerans TaxID=450367 RepID=UPI00105A9490|nr:Cof-type HAD-IIB family hydrolase [Peribacillus frigoritolerans]TDL83051.1 HAD family phosphatase [Peribacillus frigoritolerans]
MTKLIAIDLDGTLLNSENKISEENLKAIKAAQKEGIEVVVATGRAHFDVKEIFKDTGVKTWVIAANGATIHNPEGALFHSQPMEKDTAAEALQFLERNHYYYEVFGRDAIYTPQSGRELLNIEIDRIESANPDADRSQLLQAAEKQYSQTGFRFVESYMDILNQTEEIYNILAFSFHQEKLDAGWETFKDTENITLVTSAAHNFEIEHELASKGIALQKLSAHLAIELKDTAAIGDSMNDKSMLEIAGKSIAMGNARPEIKAICRDITLTNDQDGVELAIKRMMDAKQKV